MTVVKQWWWSATKWEKKPDVVVNVRTLNTRSNLSALSAERPKDPARSWWWTQNTSNTDLQLR